MQALKTSDWIAKLKEDTKDLRVTGEDNEANPTLELALLMDCTSSMSSWIAKAKETLNEIIDKVVEECKEEGNLKVRVCFVGYRDITDGSRFAIMEFTDDVDAVRNFIKGTHAQGGADTPEDLQGGLKLALHQDWTEEASKRVFLICDAPCHGKKYHSVDDSYPAGSPDGLVLEDLMKEFCKKEIEFQVVKLDNNCNTMIEEMKKCHQELEVTDMTGMKYQPSYSYESYGSYDRGMELGTALERGDMLCAAAEEFGSLDALDDLCERSSRKKKKSGSKMIKSAKKSEKSSIMGGLSKLKNFFGGSAAAEESIAPRKEISFDKSRKAAGMGPMPEMAMMSAMEDRMEINAAPKRDLATESYVNEAVKGLSMQVSRKQAAVRSKKSML